VISREDMTKVIDRLTGNQWMLTDDKLEIIIEQVGLFRFGFTYF